MFFVECGFVKFIQTGTFVCPVSRIDLVIHELVKLKNSLQRSKTHCEEDEEDEDVGSEMDDTERYTAEGIDRLFKALPSFHPSKENWEHDSVKNWEGIPNKELFNRYQKHAETFCAGCLEYGVEPTYEGFRTWLISLKSLSGKTDFDF